MSSPRVGVLALQGDVREHLDAFARCGVETTAVRSPHELDALDALAIPGGESTTISRLVRVFGLEDPLRERLSAGLPCFVTCAGMILLSREILDGRPDQLALGALDIAVRRNGYGRQVDSFEAPLSVTAFDDPAPFPAMFIRAPRVERCGSAVEVLATYDHNPVALAQGPHLAMAFHPEMNADTRLHRLFLERAGLVPARAAA